MNRTLKRFLVTVLCTGLSLALYAEPEIKTFNKTSDWLQEKALVQTGETTLQAEISSPILSREMLTLDSSKLYFISGSIKVAEGSPKGKLYYGFRVYDNDGKQLNYYNCVTVSGSDTELLEGTEPTDTSIIVKDASKWKAQSHLVIAYNTRPDRSDLPNRNILLLYPKKIEQKENGWEIQLSKTINVVLPAGTQIREHCRGGEYYCGLGNDQKAIALNKTRIWWWGGISKVRMLVNANSTEKGKKMKLDMSGLQIEIREKKK